ncbi:unnamed protein product [Paramecium sonneborni]|uniref:PARP catalytic domain-containing protein n=1 Tax=Paramecium sonneborni TaxID=65129 RepID=A0A8S1MWS9_9CILI|nr:unnamed protein product [Paramecium sonneborni]
MSIRSNLILSNNHKKINNQSKSEIVLKNQTNEQNISFIQNKIKSQLIIKQKPIEEQIVIIRDEIKSLEQRDDISSIKRKFYQSQLKSELVEKLEKIGRAQIVQIPHMNQNLDISNPELMLYVLKESFAYDQNRKLLITNDEDSCGLESLISVYGKDQECLSFRSTDIEYETFCNDQEYRNSYIRTFQEKVSQIFQVPPSDIEMLDVAKGSTILRFTINGRSEIENNQEEIKFLENVCGGQITFYNYFVKANQNHLSISLNDFDPKYNMSWNNFPEKEKRGPKNDQYDYYFPKGCYGFGLNINNLKNKGKNLDWIKMDGNKDEWRILFHGTQNQFVVNIIKEGLQQGNRNAHFSCSSMKNQDQIGKGIYFSDKFEACLEYAHPVQIGDKQFKVLFMSRVNPQKIVMCQSMIKKRYFVVNNSEDVRSYRILLYQSQGV